MLKVITTGMKSEMNSKDRILTSHYMDNKRMIQLKRAKDVYVERKDIYIVRFFRHFMKLLFN